MLPYLAYFGLDGSFGLVCFIGMDWESKFSSIVRETESNLAKVKVSEQAWQVNSQVPTWFKLLLT